MCSFKSIYFVIFVLNLYKINAQISDKRLCVDPECKEPVSLAKTLLRYPRSGPGILSFAPNEKVTVYSKEAGSISNLWGVEINGKRGYIPKDYVREQKVIKKPTLLVDTELKQMSQVPLVENGKNVDPNKVQKSFEVVDGTTIYLNPRDDINPSSTVSPVVPTAVPPNSNEVGDATETLKSDKGLKPAAAKEAEKESVVDNVLSTLSSWMKDDPTSEESDEGEEDENDEEDDDDDEEEEEEIEENMDLTHTEGLSIKKSILQEPEDINSLHNLPAGLAISAYSLDISTNADKGGQEVIKQKQNVGGGPTNAVSPDKELKDIVNDISKVDVNSEITSVTDKAEKVADSEITVKNNPEALNPATPQAKSSNPEPSQNFSSAFHSSEPSNGTSTLDFKKPPEANPATASNVDAPSAFVNAGKTQSENPDGVNSETVGKDLNDAYSAVTEPTVVEKEEVPILENVTPYPIEFRREELTGEKSVDHNQPSQQKVEENKNHKVEKPNLLIDVDQPSGHLQNLSVTDQATPKSLPSEPSQTADSIQSEAGKAPEATAGSLQPPLVDFFNLAPKTVAEVEETKNEQLNKDFSQENVSDQGVNEQTQKIDGVADTTVKGTVEGNLTNNINEEEEVNVAGEVTVPKEGAIDPEEGATDPNQIEDQDTIDPVKGVTEVTQIEDQENVIEEGAAEVNDIETQEDVSLEDDRSNEDFKEGVGSKDGGGLFSSFLSLFGVGNDEPESKSELDPSLSNEESADIIENNAWLPASKESVIEYCDAKIETCNNSEQKDFKSNKGLLEDIELSFSSDMFLYLLTTSISVIVFLFGYMVLDRSRREAPLVARINKLEKELLITLKENELLQEKGSGSVVQDIEGVSNEEVEQLRQRVVEMQVANQVLEARISELGKELEDKEALEEQIESLEKELETSTEVGMELNRIISEMLDPTNGSEKLKENVEQLQRQLLEQKDTINTNSVALKEKESENQTLRIELEKSKKKSGELQNKLEEMVDKVLQIEKEKDQQQGTLQNEISVYHQKYSEAVSKVDILNNEIQILRVQLTEVQRQADIKTKENKMLQDSVEKIKSLKNDKDALKSLLDSTSIRAELQQLKSENENYTQQLQHEQSLKAAYEKKYQAIAEEVNLLHQKYELADKEKVEANSRLEVLNNYFKKREGELQEEVIKYKSIWEVKEGEATSTTERIKYMQEEIENYKAQNETLKQEIISQEIGLKSQISMLEKKVHENWVTARQTERKLEDAKQEAAQLRNRLTLRERAIIEERAQNGLQSPLEQNGDLPLSPHPIDSPASPPLLYGGRDHITKSPPIPGLPPFLPPPPGAPFIPPPLHGMPPFMPPPPSMFPGDHRPPPLGRMSSPPLNSRYSPDTSAFSPYDRNTPSPPYDSEYGASMPPGRGYSPYNGRDDKREFKRRPFRAYGRTIGSMLSTDSEYSNESDKANQKQSKKV